MDFLEFSMDCYRGEKNVETFDIGHGKFQYFQIPLSTIIH